MEKKKEVKSTLFKPGKIFMSNSVKAHLIFGRQVDKEAFANFVNACLSRHLAGDYGDVPFTDKAENETNVILEEGSVVSSYESPDYHRTLRVVTDYQCHDPRYPIVTTIRFADEK